MATCRYQYPHNVPADRKWKGDECGKELSRGNTSGYCMRHAPMGFSGTAKARHITLNRQEWEKARRPY